MAGPRWVIVAAAAVVVAASCTSGPDGAGGESLQEAFELTPEQYRARLIVAEEEVARCMKAKGFDYVPSIPPPGGLSSPPAAVVPTREWVAEYGYGISTGPMDTPYPTEAEAQPQELPSPAADPLEAQAYEEALYGDPNEAGEVGGHIGSTGVGGC